MKTKEKFIVHIQNIDYLEKLEHLLHENGYTWHNKNKYFIRDRKIKDEPNNIRTLHINVYIEGEIVYSIYDWCGSKNYFKYPNQERELLVFIGNTPSYRPRNIIRE